MPCETTHNDPPRVGDTIHDNTDDACGTITGFDRNGLIEVSWHGTWTNGYDRSVFLAKGAGHWQFDEAQARTTEAERRANARSYACRICDRPLKWAEVFTLSSDHTYCSKTCATWIARLAAAATAQEAAHAPVIRTLDELMGEPESAPVTA